MNLMAYYKDEIKKIGFIKKWPPTLQISVYATAAACLSGLDGIHCQGKFWIDEKKQLTDVFILPQGMLTLL